MKYKLLIFGYVLCLNTLLNAQANLSVQGSIQNSSGVALADGKYNLTFRLYESAAEGTAVWSETQSSIEVAGGLYSAVLGRVTPLTASFDKPYYLGVSVNNSQELLPRARLSSASYALSLIGQSNIFPSTGTVGIGTQTPDANAQVHVKNGAGAGKITIEGPDGAEIVFKEGDNAASVSYDGDKINISNFNLVFNEGIKLPAGKTIRYNGEADWRLVDIDDFKNGNDGWICHYNWSDENVAPFGRFTPNTPFSRGYFLRPTSTGNSCLKKQFDLTGIPHTMVKVVFTYHFFDTWDYPEFAWAAFASQPNPYVQTGQSNGFFQLGWRKMSYAFNPRDAGYTDFVSTSRDTNVRGSMVAQTTLDKFWILFGSDLNSGANDESYGISDIEIWVR